eukprot:m.120118 g.120118  ORF g.120118 m.120118 type:complete len:233 (+) comp14347_c0_seq2:165-863(+)
MDNDTLLPVTFTFVEYKEGDLLGKFLAYASLLPVFIGFGLGVAIIARREFSIMTLLIGLIVDERLNAIIKNITKQPRPARGEGPIWSEYGMPSSHTEFMFFLATYVTLWLSICVKSRVRPELGPIMIKLGKFLVIAGMYCLAFIVAFSRFYLEYHTMAQVIVGACVGIGFGVVWFFLASHYFAKFYPVLENLWISRLFLLKDSSDIDDVLLFEYETAQAYRRNKRKLNKHRH